MKEKMTITFEYEDDDGEIQEVELPGRFEVCGRCEGRGTHVSPSIDGHGITGEEWNGPDWDDESKEMYMSGGYDVCCYECSGKRVVLEIDEAACDKDLLKRYDDVQRDLAEDAAISRTERMMERGYDY